MALAVVDSARKLRPYFQSHFVEVLTNQQLRTILQNTNRAGRVTKWAIELGELEITYKNRTAAKYQVLADFLVEVAPELVQDRSTQDNLHHKYHIFLPTFPHPKKKKKTKIQKNNYDSGDGRYEYEPPQSRSYGESFQFL